MKPRRYLGTRVDDSVRDASQADFILYTRQDCLRCELAEQYLRAFCHAREHTCALVDIDASSATLRQRYHTEVPVLMYRGRELCRHELDPAVLDQTVE